MLHTSLLIPGASYCNDMIYGSEGNGHITLDGVECNGSENAILECKYNSFNNCSYQQDIVVICDSGTTL